MSVPGDGGIFKYKAFISYSHRDRATVKWLHHALEAYRVPRELVGTPGRDGPIPKHLFPIFRDRDELSTSSDLAANIREALEQSANLIVVCSKAATKSRWVNEEILLFKRLGRADRVHALILDGEPNSVSPDEECFPPGLRFRLGSDGQTLTDLPEEPIAADLRPEGDGQDISKLKLLAGMLGIRFNSLRQREVVAARRRTRAIRAVVAAIVALVLAVGYSSWRSTKYEGVSNERQIAGVRVERHLTTVDLTGWAEVTQAEVAHHVKKSAALATQEYTVIKTQEYAQNYVHIEGTTSDIPPDIIPVTPCKVERRKPDGASQAPYEFRLTFDISKLGLDDSTVLKYMTRFWNAFQTPEQEWAGVRVSDQTDSAQLTVIFPPSKHPPEKSLVFYYHDIKYHRIPTEEAKTTLDKDGAGLVSRVTWDIESPKTDRSYCIRWNWDAIAK
jgi:hypothetical protein